MKTYLKSFFKEVAELIRSESGEFQPYDRKVDLIGAASTGRAARTAANTEPGARTDIYLQSTHPAQPRNPESRGE